MSFLRAAHAESERRESKLPDVAEEEEDESREDVLIPAATMESPYLTSFAFSSQPDVSS